MKVGFSLASINPIATPEFVVAAATRAEANGFSSLWVGEHVVLFDDYESTYPYDDSGKLFVRGEVGMLEPFQLLAFCGRDRTHPARDRGLPGPAAQPRLHRQGRRHAGLAVRRTAGLRDRPGLERARSSPRWTCRGSDRGARCTEYVEVMRRLWVDPVSEYHGEIYDLPRCRCYPKPLQQPHPPIHIGGESDAALQRVARQGDGWHGFRLTPPQAAERVQRLSEMLAENGHRLDDVEVTIGTYMLPGRPRRARGLRRRAESTRSSSSISPRPSTTSMPPSTASPKTSSRPPATL